MRRHRPRLVVVRYNKRSFEVMRRLRTDRSFLGSETYKRFAEHPLSFLIEDARSMLAWARSRYPRARKKVLDLDGDGRISKSEFKAWDLRRADFKIAFFQGEWDNLTPSYGVKAIQLLNSLQWKKDIRFHYFPGLGHDLDRRSDYYDVVSRSPAPFALQAWPPSLTPTGESER